MKKYFLVTGLLLVFTGVFAEDKKTPATPPLNEAPENVVVIERAGKYYRAEKKFVGNSDVAVESLLNQINMLSFRVAVAEQYIGKGVLDSKMPR